MAAKKSVSVYQLKVALAGLRPPIWRRVLVPANINLAHFHVVLQIVMGWQNGHLHQFIHKKILYGMPESLDSGFGPEQKNETRFKLNQLLKKEKDHLVYEYDFGDDWQHKITLEKILPYENNMKLPQCIKGKRACPPEDCGGIWGYADLLESVNDPSHPDHEDLLDWLGDDFDPEFFDLADINGLLKRNFK